MISDVFLNYLDDIGGVMKGLRAGNIKYAKIVKLGGFPVEISSGSNPPPIPPLRWGVQNFHEFPTFCP